jgi:hypothetical protein
MKRKVYILAAVGILLCFAACTANMAMKPWSEQTPKDRLVWMLGIYNAQDRDYRSMVAMPNLTAAQKSVLQNKKKVMTQVYPLIDAYRITVNQGGTPDQATEQTILNLLNQLQTVGG